MYWSLNSSLACARKALRRLLGAYWPKCCLLFEPKGRERTLPEFPSKLTLLTVNPWKQWQAMCDVWVTFVYTGKGRFVFRAWNLSVFPRLESLGIKTYIEREMSGSFLRYNNASVDWFVCPLGLSNGECIFWVILRLKWLVLLVSFGFSSKNPTYSNLLLAFENHLFQCKTGY